MPPSRQKGTPVTRDFPVRPQAFMRLMLRKVEQRHQKNLNPMLRGTVVTRQADGRVTVQRTGYDAPDLTPYTVLSEPVTPGQDVMLQRVNGENPVVLGAVDSNAHFARVRRQNNQSIPNNSEVALDWEFTSSVSPSTMVNLATNDSRVIARKDGWFEGKAGFAFAANVTGTRAITLYHVDNSSGTLTNIGRTEVGANTTAGRPTDICVVGQWDFSPGDSIECHAFQTSGGALNVSGTPFFPWLSLKFIAP